jgi:hypothetical protein
MGFIFLIPIRLLLYLFEHLYGHPWHGLRVYTTVRQRVVDTTVALPLALNALAERCSLS